MLRTFDRYIIRKLFSYTVFILLVLIFIFIMIDFSENSDDFTDQGAQMAEIWQDYYLNYIPEMIRLVLPVAIFTSCLFLTGQMSERLEITALKAAGVSLYRLIGPYLLFAVIAAVTISYLDANVIPKSNEVRIAFEQKYLKRKSDNIDGNDIHRQLSENSVLQVNYYDRNSDIAYKVRIINYQKDGVTSSIYTQKMEWLQEEEKWRLQNPTFRTFKEDGFVETEVAQLDTALSVLPRDLSRTTSDIYQLTYAEAEDYIDSIIRSGAGSVNIPLVQYYGRVAYPMSVVVVMIIGFAIASVRRKGGKGIYIASGLTISFLYLSLMKISEPFGYYDTLSPLTAATLPHIFFLCVGIVLLIQAKK